MESLSDLDKRYRIERARKLRLPRIDGNIRIDPSNFDECGLGVLLQYPARFNHILQPPPLCFENEWQPQYDASLCETPLQVGTLDVPVINGARVVGPGIVIAKNDVIVHPSTGRHAKRYGLEVDNDGACTVSADLQQIMHRALSEDAVSRHEGTALLLLGPSIEHFGMCILKCLPKLTVLRLLSESDIRVVVPTNVPDKYLNLMQALGVPRGQIVFHDPRGVSVFAKLLLPPKTYTFRKSRYGNPFEVFCGGVESDHGLSSRLLSSTSESRRIYVTRRGNRRRRLADTKAVERLFAEFGFKVVEPSTLTAAQTISLFQDCEFVAGPFGSGLYNILFSRQVPRALVLVPPVLKFDKQFLTMGHVCTSKGGNAGYVFGRMLEGSRGPGGEFDYSWEIDVGRLREVLATLVGQDLSPEQAAAL